jgi:hypothetical protein
VTTQPGEGAAARTPAELLAAWRTAERSHALAAAGTANATALRAEMRRLMDEYEWTVRGGVAPRREEPGRRGRRFNGGPRNDGH